MNMTSQSILQLHRIFFCEWNVYRRACIGSLSSVRILNFEENNEPYYTKINDY